MNISEKISYNKMQANRYEWKPSWFDCFDFNEELVESIKKFQTKNGLIADGLCGPTTYRRMWTQRESNLDYVDELIMDSDQHRYIIHNGNPIKIHWPKVVLWDQPYGLQCKKGSYSDKSGKKDREPKFFVTHWDVCLSAKSCAKVLQKRGLSVHFCIDNDGTIYQLLDTQHVAYHAGSFNARCIGVEVSCAYATKYQSWYKKNGFGERPIIDDAIVHGKKLSPFLGFYQIQKNALAALWEAISRACDIPLELPEEENTISHDVISNKFSGFCCHYHLTTRKIDCAGLDLHDIRDMSLSLNGE